MNNNPQLIIEETQDAMQILHEISNVLNTGLTKEQLSILVSLTESGINPEALTVVVKELQKEAAAKKS